MPAQSKLLVQSIRDVVIVDFVSKQIRELSEIEKIGDALYDLVDNRNATKLIIDFSKVQVLSSQALGVFVKLREKVRRAEGRMVLCGVSRDLHHLFKISCLARVFDFCHGEEAALASFGVTSGG